MKYRDLREFITGLEANSKLKRIQHPVSSHSEMTEIASRVLRAEGSALLFEHPIKPDGTRYDYPALANLFGMPGRVVLDMGADSVSKLREIGQTLMYLKEPEPPRGIRDVFSKLPLLKNIWNMAPNAMKNAPCQEIVWEGEDVDLYKLPIQHCWPEGVAPLVTQGLTIMCGPYEKCQNLDIYRQQLIDKNKLIMCRLSHRGGALDCRGFRKPSPGTPYPAAVMLGCDSVTILGTVTSVPGILNEYQFVGSLRGSRTELVKCISNGSQASIRAGIALEDVIHPNGTVLGGPCDDHTDYHNEQDHFPVFTVEHITVRENPIYRSAYTGKSPDEPAVSSVALNEVLIPLLRKQFSEITDFYPPLEGCFYHMAMVSMKKQYVGHVKRMMMGCWSFLRQSIYTKFIIVVDGGVNVRDWKEVIRAVTTRADPVCDTVLVKNTSIDYLDFVSPVNGLGGKMGSGATNKWPGEINHEWDRVIRKNFAVTAKTDEVWERLGLQMSFLLEFILQVMVEMIEVMFEGTAEILRLDWGKRKLSKEGLIMLTVWSAAIVALIVYMVIPRQTSYSDNTSARRSPETF